MILVVPTFTTYTNRISLLDCLFKTTVCENVIIKQLQVAKQYHPLQRQLYSVWHWLCLASSGTMLCSDTSVGCFQFIWTECVPASLTDADFIVLVAMVASECRLHRELTSFTVCSRGSLVPAPTCSTRSATGAIFLFHLKATLSGRNSLYGAWAP